MQLALLSLVILSSCFGLSAAFDGQIQRLLTYASTDRPLTRNRVTDMQGVLNSKDTIIIPMLDNRIFVKEYSDSDVIEPLYLAGGSALKEDDGNRYIYLGEDASVITLKYAAVEFKDMSRFEEYYKEKGPPSISPSTSPSSLSSSSPSFKLTCRSLRDISERIVDEEALHILAHAVGMNTWHTRTKFCARCGASLRSECGGARLRCTEKAHSVVSGGCGASSYPRLEPATMSLVTDETNSFTLLGRKASWPAGRYSCLAGFLEVGETLEQCIARETFEESGVRVEEDSIRYLGSQPWPFPSSVMVGYRATALGGPGTANPHTDHLRGLPLVDFDDEEMQEVRWFSRKEVVHALEASIGATSLGSDPGYGYTRREQALEGTVHFPGKSSMARVLLEHWALE
jgi:NADH pyrophosphatase NudC (nudix superfamily)